MFNFLPEQFDNTIAHDGIDRLIHDGILEQSQDLRAIKERGTKLLTSFPYLQEDVFYSLFKPHPELLPPEKITPQCALNRQEMEKLLETPSYKNLRQFTQLEEFGSGLGTKALMEELFNQLKEDKTLQDAIEKINRAAEMHRKAEELQNELNEMGSQGNPQNSQTTQKLKRELQLALNEAQQSGAKAEQIMASAQSQLRKAISTAAEKATDECEETNVILTSWGFNAGEFQRLPFEKKLDILKVLREQQKFKSITKLVGRMRNLAMSTQKAKLDHMRVELHSITIGDDIARALTQELVALRRPVLKLNLYRKIYEKQLLQYELNHKDRAGRGPIICLIDSSGSMRGARDEWAKAVAIGLLEIAMKERRAFAYAIFGSTGDPLITNTFLPGDRTPDKILSLVTAFYGGGTNFEKPLSWALHTLKESAFNKADVVMITDGECLIGDTFLKELLKIKKAREFAIYSILIGNSSYELERWSDQVIYVNDLLDNKVAEQLFKSI